MIEGSTDISKEKANYSNPALQGLFNWSSSTLNVIQKEELRPLLLQNAGLFSKDDKDLGR